MTAVWAWLRKWGALVVGVLLLVLGGGWLWRRREAALGRVRDELAVERAKREIERLRGQREEVARQVGEKDEAIAAIDSRLAENARKIVEAHEGGAGLTDEQVAEAFTRLGY